MGIPKTRNAKADQEEEAWECALNDPQTHLEFGTWGQPPERDPREVGQGEEGRQRAGPGVEDSRARD